MCIRDRDVARVVGLVEEDILAVAAFGRVGCEVAVLVDTVFLAELLPELAADWTMVSVCAWRGGMVEDAYRYYRIVLPGV